MTCIQSIFFYSSRKAILNFSTYLVFSIEMVFALSPYIQWNDVDHIKKRTNKLEILKRIKHNSRQMLKKNYWKQFFSSFQIDFLCTNQSHGIVFFFVCFYSFKLCFFSSPYCCFHSLEREKQKRLKPFGLNI